jgi:uncharacterized protein involved in outer membrane biogenesis
VRPATRIVLYFFLFITVCIGGVLTYAGWYIQSSNFPELIERRLTDATGYEWKITGDLELSIVPLAIDASGVQVIDPVTQKKFLVVGGIQSSVDIPILFSGKVFIDHVTLQDIELILSEDLLASGKKDEVANVDTQFDLGKIAGGFDLQGIAIQRGKVVFERTTSNGREFVSASNIFLNVDLSSKTAFDLSCSVESNFLPAKGQLKVVGESDFTTATLMAENFLGTVDWQGDIELEGRTIPTSIQTKVALDLPASKLILEELKASVAAGRLTFSGDLSDMTNENWKLVGNAEVKGFSLPYWFGFTENLPTSLNHALDNIDGKLSLEVTKDHIWSDKLTATVLGMPLAGVGGVKDFAKPVIFIDASGDRVDVNKIFPEIGVNPPKVLPKPANDAPPVFRLDSDDTTKKDEQSLAELSVGYDIRIGAKEATAHGFTIGGLAFRCWPAPNEDTLTSYKIGNAYGGSVDALLTIADDLRLQATFNKVQTQDISRILAGDSIISGVADGTVDVRAKARTVYGLVAGLGGKINAIFTNGYVKSLPKKDADGNMVSKQNFFKQLKIDLSGNSLSKKPDEAGNDLPYNWDLFVFFETKSGDDSYLTRVKGPIIMSAERVLPVRGTDIDLDTTWYGNVTSRGQVIPLSARLVSKATYNLETEDVSIRDGVFAFQNQRVSVSGDVKKFVSAPEFRGRFVGTGIDLRPTLRIMNLLRWQPRDPTVFGRATLRGEFDFRDGRYALYNVVGTIDNSTLQGSLLVNLNNDIPTVRADVALGDVMLKRYFPPDNINYRAKIFNKKPWDLAWLRDVDVKGSLKVNNLRFEPIELQRLVTPVTISGGQVQIGPLEAQMYRGTFSGEFSGIFKNRLESRLVANINGVDLALASKGAAGQDYLGGTATGYLEVRGNLGSSHDILANLDGIWGVAIRDGFFGFSKNRQGEIDKTTFRSAVSDGNIRQGIMSSNNFAVTSPFVDMRGGGQIDLPNRNIDYKVSVTYARIPTVPVTITGSWDNPQITVDGLSVVPRTFGKIGGGVFSILKDALLIPFRAVDLLPSLR